MEINIIKDNDPVSISIAGDIEIMTIKDLKERIMDICENENKNIELDLSKVNYIDSSGIGVLISLLKIQKSKGKSLVISKVSPKVLNVLKLSSLTDAFQL